MTQPQYANRRKKFFDKMDYGMAIIPSSEYKTKNSNTHFPFRQDSTFFYLTGFNEAYANLVLNKTPQGNKTILFLKDKDAFYELWNGEVLGVKKALQTMNVDEVYPIEKFDEMAPTLFQGVKSLYFDLTGPEKFRNKIADFARAASKSKRYAFGPTQFIHIDSIIAKLRLFKDELDLECMRKSAQINTIAHLASMAKAKDGVMEYEIEAILNYIFIKNGSKGVAYQSIVASGNNANCLHYTANNCPMKNGDLLLIDAGCEYQYYASDVTRTFPVSGEFSPAQRDLYQLVLNTQKKCIEMVKPGISLVDIHTKAIDFLTDGLIDLRILKGNKQTIIETEEYKKFYPHLTGHWLGLDVHDVGPYRTDDNSNNLPIEVGMTFTIEPGLYIPRDTKESVPEAFRGIGIRIEDDILVTAKGYENLTQAIPKEIEDLKIACKGDFRDFLV